MSEIKVGEYYYRFNKMPAMAQLHVARRLAPLYSAQGQGEDAFVKVMSSMLDEDVEYIINSCLAVIKRKQGEAWTPLLSSAGMMFEDITLPQMLELSYAVIQENLTGFFTAIPRTSQTEKS